MTGFKRVLDLGKVDYNGRGRKNCRVTIEIEVKPRQAVAPHLTIDLKPVASDAMELSICGNIWNPRETNCYSCGQNLDEIAKLVKTPRVRRIQELWQRWHLNGLKSGPRAQNAVVSATPEVKYPDSHYDKACEALKAEGLYEVAGYKYGSAWLYEPLPVEVIEELRQYSL